MIKFAIYGKGGIGKSTIACNISAALAKKGLKVMQIGCDPKADSTALLRGDKKIPTVLDQIREKGNDIKLSDMVFENKDGIVCVEAGGPVPGLGCAGRGIINALEKLESMGAYDVYKPDVVIYDVLGDVVCGGFSMPMRKGFADKVFVVTSGEKMSRYAAGNICIAVENFKGRGYASLGGVILNKRNVKNEDALVQALADDFNAEIVGKIERSDDIQLAEEKAEPVLKVCPDSAVSKQLFELADRIYDICGGAKC
ncbi:MAG: AAA family ATPase [Firmicutes bacterium]|nr:AAA family ATPase [Bacillota bacterium]